MALPPRSPVGQEIYVFPTVTTPPTSVTDEHGVEPGVPEPADTNNSDIGLSVIGAMREESEETLPASVTVVDVGIFIRSLNTSRPAGPGGPPRPGQRPGARGTVSNLRNSIPVPRFGVTIDGNLLAVQQNYTKWVNAPNSGALPVESGFRLANTVSGQTDTTTETTHAPALVEGADGKLYCIFLLKRTTADADVNKHKLVAFRYDQGTDGTDGGWTQVGTILTTSFLEDQVAVEENLLTDPNLAACLYQGTIYVFVTERGVAFDRPGRFYVFRLNPASASEIFPFVGGPVDVSTAENELDCGFTAVGLRDRVIVACGVRVKKGLGDCRTVFVGQSTDLRTWSRGDGNEDALTAISDFRLALNLQDTSSLETFVRTLVGSRVSGIRGIDFETTGTMGWAVNSDGRIFHTTDGGNIWIEQASPVNGKYGLSSVAIAGVIDGNFEVWACGSRGIVLRTTDSGSTWKIVTASEATTNLDLGEDFIGGARRIIEEIGDGTLREIISVGPGIVWVVGEKSKIAFTNTGSDESGGTWVKFDPPDTDAEFHSIEILKTSQPYTILVGGLIRRTRTESPVDVGSWLLLRITNAGAATDDTVPDVSPPFGNGKFGNYTAEIPSQTGKIVGIQKAGDGTIFAVSSNAKLYTSSTSTSTWTGRTFGSSGISSFLGLTVRSVSEGINSIFILAGLSGVRHVVLHSDDNGATWVQQNVGDVSGFFGKAIKAPGTNRLVVGAGAGIWISDLVPNNRYYPNLVELPDRSLLLASSVVHLSQGAGSGSTEVLRSVDYGATWQNFDEGEHIEFTSPATIEIADAGVVPRPCMTVTVAGEVLLSAGTDSVVLPPGGVEWVRGNDKGLPLLFGKPSGFGAANILNRTLVVRAYGGGRLFLMSMQYDGVSLFFFRTWTSRHWELSGQNFMPVVMGVPQWIGIDGLKVVFEGTDPSPGDTWTIQARYRYSAANLNRETRGVWWRSDTDTESQLLAWDREHPDVVAVMRRGSFFDVTAFSLFGTTFRRCSVILSLPSYSGDTFPDSASDRVVVPLSSVIQTGVIIDTPPAPNILKCSGNVWIPGQFSPSTRTYYVAVGAGAYKILDNSEDYLIIERDENDPAISNMDPFEIYTDRMFSAGKSYFVAGDASQIDLIESPYRFARFLGISIPPQATAEGYFKIEECILGRHVPISFEIPEEGQVFREMLEAPLRWQPIASTIEETGISGVSSVRHYGRPLQRWAFRYPATKWVDSMRTLIPMLPKLRRAFCIVFDSEDSGTAELVRITTSLPEGIFGENDLVGLQLELQEIG